MSQALPLSCEIDFAPSRHLWIGPTTEKTVAFATEHWISCAIDAIDARGLFAVALSGGSTPEKIFKALKSHPDFERVDWKRCFLFWGDERSVPPEDPDSNYSNALKGGIRDLPIPEHQIFRMVAEENIRENARAYQKLIETHVPGGTFDLVMLGVGEDGHTASLFPGTKALTTSNCLVTANEVPQKKTWRMTLTYPCINAARSIAIYALGERKAPIIKDIFLDKKDYPSVHVGTPGSPALWILDKPAAEHLLG